MPTPHNNPDPSGYDGGSHLTASENPIMTVLPLAVLFAAFAVAADPPAVKFGKLAAEVPKDWKAEKPANRLRSHQFKLPAGVEGLADAELYVMPQSDPNPDKSFPRWKASFIPPDGAKVSKIEVSGATVHLLDVSGTWKYRERPFDPKSKEELRPEYRAVWAIVVHGDEATHLRLSGPRAVVAKHYSVFEKWLRSLR